MSSGSSKPCALILWSSCEWGLDASLGSGEFKQVWMSCLPVNVMIMSKLESSDLKF